MLDQNERYSGESTVGDDFETDLAEILERISIYDPDYVVPLPRKAVKLLRLHADLLGRLSGRVFYTTAFYWSPSLGQLTGKRVALLDDAVIRGKTLKRHKTRFLSEGASVQTYAVYRCTELNPPLRFRSTEAPDEVAPVVLRDVIADDYVSYNGYVQRKLRAINPLHEPDHLRYMYSFNASLTDELFIDFVATLGDSVAYPYNLNGSTLGVTVLHPLGETKLRSFADRFGIFHIHSKIRAFYEMVTQQVVLVPMVFPDIVLSSQAHNPESVWRVLSSLNIDMAPLPAWTSGTRLRNSDRLVYELICTSLASLLLSQTLANTDKLPPMSVSLDDIVRRFGPELSTLVKTIMEKEAVALSVLATLARTFVNSPQLDLALVTSAVGDFRQQRMTLYGFCADLVVKLKEKFDSAAEEFAEALDDRQGWTYSEITERWSGVSKEIVSQGIDFLCDNGFIVPWFGKTDSDPNTFGRKYRTGEYTKLKATFDAVLDFVAFAIRLTRNTIPEMRDGVELTFLNKLLTNVLIDAEQFLSATQSAKLEAVSPKPDLFGPVVKINHLLTAYNDVGLFDLTRYGFKLRERSEQKSRGLIEPPDRGTDLTAFDSASASLIEELIKIYIVAYSKLGHTVQDVLLPLALYRHREDAYAYMHKDLVLWLEAFESVSLSWQLGGYRRLRRAREALDSFNTKYNLGSGFPRLWKRFVTLAEKSSITLGARITKTVDVSASDRVHFRRLHSLHVFYEALQDGAEALLRHGAKSTSGVRSKVENGLEVVGLSVHGEPLIAHLSAANTSEFLERAVILAAEQLASVQEPSQHIALLRAARLRDKDMTNRAIREVQSIGKLPVYAVMGDLFQSKALTEHVGLAGMSSVTYVLDPYQELVERLATAYHGRRFNLPHGDDFHLFFTDIHEAITFSSLLHEEIATMAQRISDLIPNASESDIQVVPKLGLVSINSFDRDHIQQRIHLCSILISSTAPAANAGHTLIGLDRSEIPEPLLPKIRAHCEIEQFGVVFRLER